MKKVTIQDIADALGISRNTVSKAINNADGLAEATRERILQKAAEMGYKQFSYINSLRNMQADSAPAPAPGFAGEIALFTSIFFGQSHFASPMLDRFQHELAQLGYSVNVHRVTAENVQAKTLPLSFVRERASAIVCVEMFDWDYDEMVCGLGLPVLFVDGPVKADGRNLPADQLYMDNMTEVAAITQELLHRGLRRIGFVGDYLHCQSFFERYTAFRTAMLMAGAPVDERQCLCYNHQDEIAERLYQLEELPDVFICANDFVAGDVMRALFSIGKLVPEDVLLLGFDDSAESRRSRPMLSTIHIHTQIMAFSAVQLLITRIQEPSLDYRIVHTQTDLIYRESTNN